MLGFYAIGTGAHSAMSSLSHAVEHLDLHTHSSSASEVLYHAMAAKFMSESATDVGRDTFEVVLRKDEGRDKISPIFLHFLGGDEYVRKRWEKDGAPRTPEGIAEAIEDLLGTTKSRFEIPVLEKAAKHSSRAKAVLEQKRGLRSQG